jgi:hypothetical protein
LKNFVEGVVFGPVIGYASFIYGEEVDVGVGGDLAGRRDGTERTVLRARGRPGTLSKPAGNS